MLEVCKSNNLIPSNLEAAKKYDLVTKKVVLSTKLENTHQFDAYKKYITSLPDSVYLFETPETGVCPLPLGEDNAPVVEITAPSPSSEAKVGSTVEITGSVRYLESISEFKVTFGGKNIQASLNADGSYLIHYIIPEGTTVGDTEIVVTAKDNRGKTSTSSVKINVKPADIQNPTEQEQETTTP